MNKILIPILASILLLGVIAYSPISFADDDDDDDDGFDVVLSGGDFDDDCFEEDDDDTIRIGIHQKIAHVLDDSDDDDDDDRDARDDDDDDDDEPCVPEPPAQPSIDPTEGGLACPFTITVPREEYHKVT